MKRNLFKRASAAAAGAVIALMSVPAVPAMADDDSFKTGYTNDGYYWTIWNEKPELSSADLTMGSVGKFEASWNSNMSEVMFTVGKKAEEPLDWKNTWDRYWHDVDYDVEIQSEGISWFGCYGYFESPLVEYYIVEGYCDWISQKGENLGTYNCNGAIYELFYDPNAFSKGDLWVGENDTACIYAIRKGRIYCETPTEFKGSIAVMDHFEKWQELGIPNIDKVSEVSLGVYGWNSKGSIKAKENYVNTKMEPIKPDPSDPDPEETDSPNGPDKDGYLFCNKFENGKSGYWGSTDRSEISVSDGVLTVSGMDEYDHVFRKLSTEEFRRGKAYDFSVDVMQDDADRIEMDFGIGYINGCMPVHIRGARAALKKGEWTTIKLENVVIPDDEYLKDLELALNPRNTAASFSIDNAYGRISTAEPVTDVCIVDPTTHEDSGYFDGHYWYKHNMDYDGIINMTVGKNGTYNADWDGIGEAKFGCGMNFEDDIKWKELENIKYSYEMDYHPEGKSCAEIKGFFMNKEKNYGVDFHIIERWGEWTAPNEAADLIGTETIDGVEYDIYVGVEEYVDMTCYIVWSVRKDGGNADGEYSGTITLSDHFAAWEKAAGRELGDLQKVLFNVLNDNSTGSINVTKNELVLGASVGTPAESVKGDVNCDGKVTVADAAAILQYLGNADKYPLSGQAKANADFDGEPGITTADAVAIQRELAK